MTTDLQLVTRLTKHGVLRLCHYALVYLM